MRSTSLLVAIFTLFFHSLTIGQEKSDNSSVGSFGVQAGANFSMVEGTPWKPKFNPGAFGGVYKSFRRGNNGFRIELNVAQGHFTTMHPASYVPGIKKVYTDPTFDTVQPGDFNTLYVRIPLLGEFRVYKTLYFLLGPEYSMLMSIKDNNGAFTTDYATNGGAGNIFKTGCLMGDVGFHVVLKQRIIFGTRLSVGLGSINKQASSPANNNFRDYGGWKLWSSETYLGFNLSGNE